jgi:hypothetical protein
VTAITKFERCANLSTRYGIGADPLLHSLLAFDDFHAPAPGMACARW